MERDAQTSPSDILVRYCVQGWAEAPVRYVSKVKRRVFIARRLNGRNGWFVERCEQCEFAFRGVRTSHENIFNDEAAH